MSNDTDTTTRKPLKLSSPGKLELKKTVDGGQVRQSFPHGRTKTVAVEVKKKRTYTQGVGGKMTEVPSEAEQKLGLAPAAPVVEIDDRPHHTLTEHERVARLKALEQAKRDEDVRKQFEEEEAKRVAERTEREKAELDKRRREEEERKVAEDAAKVARETEASVAVARSEKADASGAAHTGKMHLNKAAIAKQAVTEDDDNTARRRPAAGHRGAAAAPARPAPARTREDQRRRGAKLTVVQALDSETNERMRSVAAFRRRTEKEKRALMQEQQAQLKVVREVVLPEAITVQELANRMAERGGDVIKSLMKMGVMATINQTIDADTAELIIAEFGHRVRL
ncbi:MAG: translation initiation factor IF-2 N-terminal domain-containing protein, partial [Dongia sp.]